MSSKGWRVQTLLGAFLAAALASSGAQATEGYFQHGFGARYKALGGAGAASSTDATAASLNPAGLVHVGTEASAAVSWFSPIRSFEGSGPPGFTPSGTVDSFQENFFVPNLAANYRLAPGSIVDAVGFSVYGNGGMNTNYPDFNNPSCAGVGGGSGVFCGGKAGVDLQQALISIAFAKQLGPIALGVAPILSRQRFKARGLQAFGQPNVDNDVSWGAGVRGGLEWTIAPGFRFGAAGASRIYSQHLEGYEKLFAEGGNFDIPPSVQAGVAIDFAPNLTLLLDYKHIWFGSVRSIANPSTHIAFAPFGADNGPGFGWQDVDVVKVGLEYKAGTALTLRGGYAYATGALQARDVQFNILAPATVQHHLTAGFEYQLNDNWSVELAGLYAPESSISGHEIVGNPGHNIELSMHQYDVTVGFKYKFGDEPAAAPLK